MWLESNVERLLGNTFSSSYHVAIEVYGCPVLTTKLLLQNAGSWSFSKTTETTRAWWDSWLTNFQDFTLHAASQQDRLPAESSQKYERCALLEKTTRYAEKIGLLSLRVFFTLLHHTRIWFTVLVDRCCFLLMYIWKYDCLTTLIWLSTHKIVLLPQFCPKVTIFHHLP